MDPATEIQRLRALLAQRDEELVLAQEATQREQTQRRSLQKENERLQAQLQVAEDAAKRLQRELERLRRQIVGPKSERFVDPKQLPLPIAPPEPDRPAATVASSKTEGETNESEEKKPRRRRRKNKGRRDLSERNDLHTETHVSQVTERFCPCGCGAIAQTIGWETTWRLERLPAQFVRHKNLQEKIAFPDHRDAGVVQAPAPVAYALPKALCGNRLLAQVVIDKYADHLPLYRQSARFARQGEELSRSTLSRWMMELGELLRPIVQHLVLEIRSGSWLRADATGMPVLDKTRVRGKAHHGQLWAWGNYDSVVFSYTPTKHGPVVAKLFERFEGTVLMDGASDFNLLERTENVTRAGCWAHARRYFYEALDSDAERSIRALGSIRQLFLAERVVMAAEVGDRLALRDELCRPIVEGFRNWVTTELPTLVPGEPIHAAFQYVDNQWARLVVFLDRAEIPCHNNDTERDLRRPVKGKRNYLFAGSPRGAKVAAVFYSLIGTCLLQGIDPRRYLVEILGRLDEPAARLTPQTVRELWLPPAMEPAEVDSSS